MKTILFSFVLFLIWLLPRIGWAQDLDEGPGQARVSVPTIYAIGSIDRVNVALQNISFPGEVDRGDIVLLNTQFRGDWKLGDFIEKRIREKALENDEKYRQDHGLPPRNDMEASLNGLHGPAVALDSPLPPDLPHKDSFLSHISLFYGIQLIGKGGKNKDMYSTSTMHMTYLEIPVDILYNYKLANNKGRLFGGLGFYLAYGLWGKTTYTDRGGAGVQSTYGSFDKVDGFKRFDAGVTFSAGYQLPMDLRLSIAYELGLVNLDPVGGNYDKSKNRALSLNIGYPLKKLADKFRKK